MKKLRLARRMVPTLIIALTATAAAAEGQGPTALSETYDAWTVHCANSGEGEHIQRRCQMSQELLQQGTQQRVLTVVVGVTEKGPKGTLLLPFGLLLSDGFRIQIADKDIVRGTYRTCLPSGCLAEIELPDATIEQLGGAETASVLMTAYSGEQVKTDVSLKSFAAAYKRLTELTAGAGN